VPQDFVIERVDLQPLAPAVGYHSRRLGEDQAGGGIGGIHPPTPGLVDDRLIIEGVIEPKDRELEAILATGPTMAAPAVATEAGENGVHIAGEIDGGRCLDPVQHHRALPGQFTPGDPQRRPTVPHSNQPRSVETCHERFVLGSRQVGSWQVGGRGQFEPGQPGEVDLATIVADPTDQQLLPTVGTSQPQPLGLDAKGDNAQPGRQGFGGGRSGDRRGVSRASGRSERAPWAESGTQQQTHQTQQADRAPHASTHTQAGRAIDL
jgi:hypothetical protein